MPNRSSLEYLLINSGDDFSVSREDIQPLQKAAFAMEVFQITDRCHALVLSMNSRVPDESSVFKASLAFSLAKPVVLYKNDNRSAFHGWDNTMIIGLSGDFTVVEKLKQIPDKLIALFTSTQMDSNHLGKTVPPYLQSAVNAGREVWKLIKNIDFSSMAQGDLKSQVQELSQTFLKLPEIQRMYI